MKQACGEPRLTACHSSHKEGRDATLQGRLVMRAEEKCCSYCSLGQVMQQSDEEGTHCMGRCVRDPVGLIVKEAGEATTAWSKQDSTAGRLSCQGLICSLLTVDEFECKLS